MIPKRPSRATAPSLDLEVSRLPDLDFDIKQMVDCYFRAVGEAGAARQLKVSVSVETLVANLEVLEEIRAALLRNCDLLTAGRTVSELVTAEATGQAS